MAVFVAVAVASSLLTIVARAQLEENDTLPVAVAEAADVELPRSGLVVSLSRPGFADLPAALGVESAFVTSVVAAKPVAAVELLAGGEVVARVVPEERIVERADRLAWLPEATGPVTVLARAYDVEGHVGQSNPLRVDVRAPGSVAGLAAVTSLDGDTPDAIAARYGMTGASLVEWNQLQGVGPADPLPPGTALEVPIGLLAPSPTTTAALGRSVPRAPDGSSRSARPAAPPPLPAGLVLAAPPTLEVAVDGCTATVEATAGGAGQDLVLLQAPPTGGAFVPVAALTGEPVELPVTTGIHDLVVAAGDGGSLAAWSAPVTVPVTDDACSGWDGEARLDGGRLVADTEADAAYLYLSTTPTEWVRVPAEGFVARGPSGFDFTGLLPPLTGAALAVEAWGRTGAELTFIGRGTFTPPPPKDGAQSPPGSAVSIGDAVPLPKVQLWWLRPADWKHAGDPPKAVTAGEVLEPTTLKFQWSAALPGVTHGLVQVTAAPVPAQAGPHPGGVLYLGFAAGNGGTFTIDFENIVDTFLAKKNGTLIDVTTGLGTQTYQALAGLAGDDSTTSSLPYSPVPIDLDPLDDDEVQELLKQLFVVRVVPMIGDTWTGLVSNDVSLTVDTAGLFPVAPAGEKPYELDVAMVQPPRPPDPWKMSCWQFVGWTDETELQKKLAEEQAAADASFAGVNLGQYTVWKVLVDAVGSGPICGGCYHFGSLTVAVAGADCSDDDFLDMLWDGFKTFVNMLSSTFAFIKASIVDIVVSATGCKSAGDTAASICSKLATAALDAALISLGIPPSLPNWDQLVAAAKGDIVELGVGLANDLGVPCDEASFAAEVHGQKGLTCEEALSALLDEAVAQIDQLYADTAKSMGFNFPPLMKVRPHPSGQVGPAAIEITVNPTKYSAAEGGKTCSVGAYPGAAWATQVDPFATAAFGKQAGSPIVSGIAPGFTQGTKIGPVLIPQLTWTGKPFETGFWDLPDLPKATANTYGPASRTYQVYPPAELDPVQVAVLATYTSGMTDAQGKPVVGVSKFWYQWPRHVFLLNSNAIFKLVITSGCATGTGMHIWTIPGYGPGLPQELVNP